MAQSKMLMWLFTVVLTEGFPYKTNRGSTNGWQTWIGEAGRQVDISICAVNISHRAALTSDGESVIWSKQPSPPFFLQTIMYAFVFFYVYVTKIQITRFLFACIYLDTSIFEFFTFYTCNFPFFNGHFLCFCPVGRWERLLFKQAKPHDHIQRLRGWSWA